VRGFKVKPYAIPQGSIGAYYPETNPLLPLAHHDLKARHRRLINPGSGQAAMSECAANVIRTRTSVHSSTGDMSDGIST